LPLKASSTPTTTTTSSTTTTPTTSTTITLGSASTSSSSTSTISTTTTTTTSSTTTTIYTAQSILDTSEGNFLVSFEAINEYGDFYDPSLASIGLCSDFTITEGNVLIIDVPDTTEITFTGTALDASVTFSTGKNFFTLPLDPGTPYTANTLAEEISATTISKWDPITQEEVTFNIENPSENNFAIEGAQVYVVEVSEAKTVTFTGSQWSD